MKTNFLIVQLQSLLITFFYYSSLQFVDQIFIFFYTIYFQLISPKTSYKHCCQKVLRKDTKRLCLYNFNYIVSAYPLGVSNAAWQLSLSVSHVLCQTWLQISYIWTRELESQSPRGQRLTRQLLANGREPEAVFNRQPQCSQREIYVRCCNLFRKVSFGHDFSFIIEIKTWRISITFFYISNINCNKEWNHKRIFH